MLARIVRSTAIVSTMLLCTAYTGSSALAADDIIQLDVATALSTPDAKADLDGSIKFYFGNKPHPSIVKHLGEGITNKKANGVGRSSTKGCERAFLDALIQMQRRAKDLGGNAVININSYNKKHEVVIDTSVECHSGLLMAGVALKGEIVKLAE
ncbi:MAG: hypothetical protein WCA81_01835 [Rhizomicrobium sp.]